MFSSSEEAMLRRLDRWSERSHWLPDQDQWFPRGVFWGVFLWNLPILVAALAVVGIALYRADADPSGVGFFMPLAWGLELAIEVVTLSFVIDASACLWIRRVWNKRARWIRQSDSEQ